MRYTYPMKSTEFQNQQIHRAIDLYAQGKKQKEIASIMGVSEQTIVKWKHQCRNTKLDWDKAQNEELQNTQTVQQWIEIKIKDTMDAIDTAIAENASGVDSLISRLDKFTTVKKKYEGSIDKFGETARVMEGFGLFIKENYPDVVAEFEEVISAYLRAMAK